MFQNSFVAAEPEALESVSLIVCEICGKSVQRMDYDRHLRTHKEKRVEVCKICFKAFTSKSRWSKLALSGMKYSCQH